LTIRLVALMLGLLVATSAWAQGTARTLDIQPGARQVGMGAAGVALADDPAGVAWWNPAVLGYVGRPAVELTYSSLVPGLANDVTYNYLNYLHPVQGWGSFGVGILFLSYGNLDLTSSSVPGQRLRRSSSRPRSLRNPAAARPRWVHAVCQCGAARRRLWGHRLHLPVRPGRALPDQLALDFMNIRTWVPSSP
jgi:hypothetical protein